MDTIRFSRVSYWLFACESQVVSQRVSGALRVLSFRVVSELILKLLTRLRKPMVVTSFFYLVCVCDQPC